MRFGGHRASEITLAVCTLILFAKIFLVPWDAGWTDRYSLFSIHPFGYPGGDIRPLQIRAYCYRRGFGIYDDNECVRNATIVKDRYPEAVDLGPYNYPSYWVKAYALFDDDSEAFFRKVWTINAVALAAVFTLYCFRYCLVYLPVVLFSPVAVLAVERGNIDASTMFISFAPLFFYRWSSQASSFFIGFAAALKIFPAFAYASFLRLKPPFVEQGVVAGFILALPLLLLTIPDIPYMLAVTYKGFQGAYGLLSLHAAPLLKTRPTLANVVIAVFVFSWGAAMYALLQSLRRNEATDADFQTLKKEDIIVLLSSAAVFVFSFFLFINWNYRLIFVVPAMLVLSGMKSQMPQLAFWNILVALWIQVVPHGGALQNICCFPLSISLSYILARGIAFVSKSRDAETSRQQGLAGGRV